MGSQLPGPARDLVGVEGDGVTVALPSPVLVAAVLAFLLFGLGPNVVLTGGALVVLLVIWAFFWRPGEPPVLFYAFVFQWLEACIWIFYANVHGLSVDDGTAMGADRHLATVLLIAGLLVQSAGVRWVIGPWRAEARELIDSQLERTPQRTWFALYLGALVAAVIATYLATVLPGLSQPLLAIAYLRWSAYVLFTLATFNRAEASRTLWLFVFLLELASSIGEYFSSFKFVFIFTFVAIAASQVRPSAVLKLGLGAVLAVALLFGAVWSSIKSEYRDFANQGQRAQVVEVGYAERIVEIGNLISNVGLDEILDGVDTLVRRIEYVEYFADVTNAVPHTSPHTDGELWWDAVSRPFMPRLFFPGKTVIDESDLTNKFTGNNLAGMEAGTQISLGYLAETYVDFGKYLMMPVLFLWGTFIGWTYRWQLVSTNSRGVLGFGLVSSTYILTASSIGNSLAKLVGGLTVCLLVNWAFIEFIVPNFLPWLRAPEKSEPSLGSV